MKWRLIPSSLLPPNGHMEYDRELLEAFQEGDLPILRFFYFGKPTLTLGRLEARRMDLSELPYPHEIRPTGGRAVLHGKDDFCYSIVASTRDPFVGGELLTSYRKISQIFQAALKGMGREAEMSEERHRAAGTSHCFTAPSHGELLLNGRKVVGSAQARRGNVFLQQGVILLSVSPQWKEAFPGSSWDRMGGLNDGAKSKMTRVSLEEEIENAFQKAGVRFTRDLKPVDGSSGD